MPITFTPSDTNTLFKQIVRNAEGFGTTLYPDSVDIPTIGIGLNLSLTSNVVRFLFQTGIFAASDVAEAQFRLEV